MNSHVQFQRIPRPRYSLRVSGFLAEKILVGALYHWMPCIVSRAVTTSGLERERVHRCFLSPNR